MQVSREAAKEIMFLLENEKVVEGMTNANKRTGEGRGGGGPQRV